MGFFKKIFKGVKKVVKKIGRGIKKVVKKVGKAFGKLGVVGQIGLMFLMPYAMQGLGTFWKGFGGFANKLATSQGVGSQLFGKALSAVHTAGSMVGRVYTGVTDTINSAFDIVTGKGSAAEFTDSVKSIFSGPVDEAKSLLTGDKLTAFKEQALLDKKELIADTVEAVKSTEIPSIKDVINPKQPSFQDKIKSSFEASTDIPDFSVDLTAKVQEEQMKKGLGQKLLDYGSQQVENVKTAITEFDLGEEIVAGAQKGIQQRTAQEIVGTTDPVYNSTSINIPSYMGAAYANDSVADQVDFTIQQQTGNSWANSLMRNYDHVQSGLLQDETSWFHNANHARQLVYGAGN